MYGLLQLSLVILQTPPSPTFVGIFKQLKPENS